MHWQKGLILAGLFSILMASTACQTSKNKDDEAYQKKINTWHQKRIKDLTKKDSWLSLAGLYWLEEGPNSFGSDSSNDLVFPAGKAPQKMGQFNLKDSTVTITVAPNISVQHGDKLVSTMKLNTDQTGNPTILHAGSLSWFIIQRGSRFGVRLRDSESAKLKNFKGIDRFPVRKKWRIKATFTPFDTAKTMQIPTILGQTANVIVPGKLSFRVNDQSFDILPIEEEPDAKQFFIVFGDQTNGDATYGGGRFIYIPKPGADNITYIDFNKAYNPPCAFTTFATCPLPPRQNKLPLPIKAGEKKYGEGQYHKNIKSEETP